MDLGAIHVFQESLTCTFLPTATVLAYVIKVVLWSFFHPKIANHSQSTKSMAVGGVSLPIITRLKHILKRQPPRREKKK